MRVWKCLCGEKNNSQHNHDLLPTLSHRIYASLIAELFWSHKGEFSPKGQEFASM